MTFRRFLSGGLCLVTGLLMVAQSWAGEPKPAEGKVATTKEVESSEFLRIRRDKEGEPAALETSITQYVSQDPQKKGLTIDLIGAVHVGEADYYTELNKLFKSYDAVLYELVAPEGTRVVPGASRPNRHPVSFAQNIMKTMLKLDFQLDRIDYSQPNMVHADMSPEQFSKSMKDRGESFLKMFFQVLRQTMATQSKKRDANTEAELLVALIAKDRAFRLKRLMAEQFEDMEVQLAALNGPDGSTIITERNKRAFKVLSDQIKQGKRRLAVFYGAAHLPDMEKRLLADFNVKGKGQRWLVAWSLTRAAVESKKKEAAGDKPVPAGS